MASPVGSSSSAPSSGAGGTSLGMWRSNSGPKRARNAAPSRCGRYSAFRCIYTTKSGRLPVEAAAIPLDTPPHGARARGAAAMTPEEAFGQALRVLRAERRWSQERLALESGVDRSYISLLERGRQSPTLATIFRLATVLAIKPSHLLARME